MLTDVSPAVRTLVVTAVTLAVLYVLAFTLWRISAQYASPTTMTLPGEAASPEYEVKIGVFNIAHGRGTGHDNYQGGGAAERDERLTRLAALLAGHNVDVWVLNEVDFNARWSNGMNQAEALARRAGFPFVAYLPNLDVPGFVPGGPWQFGNAIVSRLPLTDCATLALPGYNAFETAFAGKKRGLSCTVDGRFDLFGVHLSHRSEDLRVASAKYLLERADRSARPVVIAGDLNSTRRGWPEFQTDRDGTSAVEVLEESREPELVLQPKTTPRSGTMTFHSQRPTSVIDWIATPEAWHVRETTVIPTTDSDHRAITTRALY